MNFVMWLCARLFPFAWRATAERTLTELVQASIEAKTERLHVALEAIDLANRLPSAEQDGARQKVIEAFKADIADLTAITGRVLDGALPPEAIARAPFGPEASATPSATESKAIGQDQELSTASPSANGVAALAPPAKRRGRPPKQRPGS